MSLRKKYSFKNYFERRVFADSNLTLPEGCHQNEWQAYRFNAREEEKERGEVTGHCAYLPILPFYAPLRREKLRLSPAALHMWLYGMTITLREQSCSRYCHLPRSGEISIIQAFTLCTFCTEFQSNFLEIWSFPPLPLFPISFLLLFPLWPLGDPSSDMQIGIAKAEGQRRRDSTLVYVYRNA